MLELEKYVAEKGYSNPQFDEKEKRFQFHVPAGQIEVKYTLDQAYQKAITG